MKGAGKIVLSSFLLLFTTNVQAVSVKWEKWFDTRIYYLQLIEARSPSGESVRQMTKDYGAIAGVNCSYFGKVWTKNGHRLFPLGEIRICLNDVTYCSVPADRGYLWQTEKPGIGFKPPKNTIFSTSAGPILILKSKIPRSMQNFSLRHWNVNCLRTVVAFKGNKIHLLKIRGSLWQIAKYLKYRGFSSAINLDGGSSSSSRVRVANAVLVFPKSRPFYRSFSAKYFKNYQSPNWLMITQEKKNKTQCRFDFGALTK